MDPVFDNLQSGGDSSPFDRPVSHSSTAGNAPKVALLIETSNAYARGVLRGIDAYLREHRAWSIYLVEHARGDRPPAWLKHWDGHGVIARIENKAIAKALEPLNVPIVDVSAACLVPSVPYVETDDRAIAHLAAAHFLERGFKTFAYCGEPRYNWSNWREENFAAVVRERGHACYIHHPPKGVEADDDEYFEDLSNWLEKMPKPLAVFACFDQKARQVLDACRRRGIDVPEAVAVLGVDNDDVLCSLAPVPMSSVNPNVHRTGWEAAALLDRMMGGEQVPARALLIPPLGIVTRQSTDVTAADDQHVAKAARFIRENACRGIGVGDVIGSVPLARRQLERRFRSVVGRTLREEITRIQMQRVKELLSSTDLSLAEIAGRTGFTHVEYLTFVFKRECGIPPTTFRAEHQPSRRRQPSIVR
jgi:LacI family transcriptional regulator